MVSRERKQWSKEEVRALKKIFGNNSNGSIATVLCRTPKAVERKAAKLGIRKTKNYLKVYLGR